MEEPHPAGGASRNVVVPEEFTWRGSGELGCGTMGPLFHTRPVRSKKRGRARGWARARDSRGEGSMRKLGPAARGRGWARTRHCLGQKAYLVHGACAWLRNPFSALFHELK